MKTNKLIIGLSTVVAALLVSYEKFSANVETPPVSIFVSPQNPKVGREVAVTINTDAQYLTPFTGDEGKKFERSRVKAIMEHDQDGFHEERYRVFYTKNEEKTLSYKYFKDYQSIEEVKKDFEFFGTIGNIQSAPYKKGDFPEALVEISYIGTNQLKFTMTDRRIPSGIRVKPGIHILGGPANQPGNTITGSRFAACDADRAIRKYSNDAWVAAYSGLHTGQSEDFGGYSVGYKCYTMQDECSYGIFQTNDPLLRRPTEELYRLGDIYNKDTYLQPSLDHGEEIIFRQVDMHAGGRSTFTAADDSPYKYDLDGDGALEAYEYELGPAAGPPVREADYTECKSFQGNVYLSSIEMGTGEHEPRNTGVSLGSVHIAGGVQKTYKYIYTGADDFTITAVATNVGDKDYKGIGYSEEWSNSLDDYSYKRVLSSTKISVRP